MTSRVETSKKLVLINSASSVLTRLLSISVLVWLQQYLLKRVTPDEFSLLPVITSVMMFVSLATTVLTSGLGRYIVEAYANNDDERVTQIVSTMFPILCVAGTFFLAGGLTFAWHIDKFLTIGSKQLWDARIMMALLVLNVAISLPASPLSVGFFVRQKFVLQNMVGIVVEIFRLAILFFLLLTVSTRVIWVVTASVSAGMLGLVISVAISRRIVPSLRVSLLKFHWPIAKEITTFGGWSFMASLANAVVTSADAVILNKIAMPIDVACFHLGALPRRNIDQLVDTMQAPLQPVLIGMYTQNRMDSLRSAYMRGGRYALWSTLFAGVPAVIFRHDLVMLYVGAEFLPAAAVMALLLASWPFWYGHTLLPSVANATTQLGPLVRRSIALQVAYLALALYLVGVLKMGALGCAIASLTVAIPGLLFVIGPLGLRMLKLSHGEWLRNTVLPGILPAIVASPVWMAATKFVGTISWSHLAVSFACGGLIYILTLLLFALKKQDREDLKRLVSVVERFAFWRI